jgi:hypothetical protein
VTANTTTDARTGDIEVTISGEKKTVTVSQAGISVGEPSQTSFPDLPVGGETGKTFTITTNTSNESITMNGPAWITNLTKSLGAVAADGSSTWTISFDVSANTTISARTGSIKVTIGGIKKTVSISQVAMYVNAPNPANFLNVIAAGETGKTFTIETNAPNEEITATTNAAWITNLTPSRNVVATDNGSSTWTISFDVSENTTTSARSGSVEVTIGRITKMVTVSQIIVADPSNCYIVAPGAKIYIPVFRANEHELNTIGVGTVFTAESLWTDTPGLLAEWAAYSIGSTGAIGVKASGGKSGNAVVAVKVGDVIKWSWHIWVTDPAAIQTGKIRIIPPGSISLWIVTWEQLKPLILLPVVVCFTSGGARILSPVVPILRWSRLAMWMVLS